MYLDSYTLSWILLIAAMAVTAFAQIGISSTYSKYAKVNSTFGYTADQVAERLLHSNGLGNIPINRVSGNLTDNYDPSRKALNLSQTTYGSSSVAALSVAAHECGHALQDADGYAPLRLRRIMVPVASFGSSGSWILIALGLFMGLPGLLQLGILLFLAVVAFQLVTLPVEFNASRRALAALDGGGYLTAQEIPMARKVLNAAALTYVAGTLSSILQLFRLLLIAGRRR